MNPNKPNGGRDGVECRVPRVTCHVSRSRAFTLIELLVVIAVIALLAALIFPVTAAVNRAKIRSKARAELGQLQLGIDDYKSKLGHYPPDNPGLPSMHALYFELLGTTNIGTAAAPVYRTLDGSGRVAASALTADFGPGVSGFVNCTPAGGGDEVKFATPFLGGLKPGQIAAMPSDPNVKFIVCSVPSPNTGPSGYLGVGTLTPFYYNSSNPTNNPGTYDLWVDVVISGKVNRICNWSKDVLFP